MIQIETQVGLSSISRNFPNISLSVLVICPYAVLHWTGIYSVPSHYTHTPTHTTMPTLTTKVNLEGRFNLTCLSSYSLLIHMQNRQTFERKRLQLRYEQTFFLLWGNSASCHCMVQVLQVKHVFQNRTKQNTVHIFYYDFVLFYTTSDLH